MEKRAAWLERARQLAPEADKSDNVDRRSDVDAGMLDNELPELVDLPHASPEPSIPDDLPYDNDKSEDDSREETPEKGYAGSEKHIGARDLYRELKPSFAKLDAATDAKIREHLLARLRDQAPKPSSVH